VLRATPLQWRPRRRFIPTIPIPYPEDGGPFRHAVADQVSAGERWSLAIRVGTHAPELVRTRNPSRRTRALASAKCRVRVRTSASRLSVFVRRERLAYNFVGSQGDPDAGFGRAYPMARLTMAISSFMVDDLEIIGHLPPPAVTPPFISPCPVPMSGRCDRNDALRGRRPARRHRRASADSMARRMSARD